MTPADLRQRREALNLTQAQLAERFGMGGKAGQVTISRWENGVIPIERPGMLDLALRCLEHERSPDG